MVKNSPSSAGGMGSIPGRGAKISRALGPKSQNMKQCCNKFNKDVKNGPTSKNLLKNASPTDLALKTDFIANYPDYPVK